MKWSNVSKVLARTSGAVGNTDIPSRERDVSILEKGQSKLANNKHRPTIVVYVTSTYMHVTSIYRSKLI